MIYIALLTQLLISFLFIDELAYSMLNGLVSLETWHILRLIPIIGYGMIRLALYRDEVQFQLNQSYFLITKMMQSGQAEKLFPYIKIRIAQILNLTWYNAAQQASCFILPLMLSSLLMLRCVTFSVQKQEAFDFQSTLEKMTAHSTQLERYDLFEDREQLRIVFNEVIEQGLFHVDYQLVLLNFTVFWYFFSSFVIMSFALMYYRKFRES